MSFIIQTPKEFVEDVKSSLNGEGQLLYFFEKAVCRFCKKNEKITLIIRANYFRHVDFCSDNCLNMYILAQI